jgi:class 3 adenylate cyclase
MAEVAETHGGTVDKFIGDCVMVFFGAPERREDHAVAALRMAWDMQLRIASLNLRWERLGRKTLNVGMGLNTDYVTFGNFGSHRFKDYTVIGKGVNLAARVESVAPGGRILLTKRTNQQVREIARTRLFGEVMLKGIQEPVQVFEVLAVEGLPERPEKPEPSVWEWEERGERRGPFPKAGIEAMLRSGRICADNLLRKADTDGEMTVADILRKKDPE